MCWILGDVDGLRFCESITPQSEMVYFLISFQCFSASGFLHLATLSSGLSLLVTRTLPIFSPGIISKRDVNIIFLEAMIPDVFIVVKYVLTTSRIKEPTILLCIVINPHLSRRLDSHDYSCMPPASSCNDHIRQNGELCGLRLEIKYPLVALSSQYCPKSSSKRVIFSIEPQWMFSDDTWNTDFWMRVSKALAGLLCINVYWV